MSKNPLYPLYRTELLLVDEEAREIQLRRHRKRLMERAFTALQDGSTVIAKSLLHCLSDEEKQKVIAACKCLTEQVEKIQAWEGRFHE